MNRRLAPALLAVGLGCGRDVPSFQGDAFARDPPQVASLAGRLVTTNNGDDTLSVLDPSGPAPAARLPVGFSPVELEGPHHISVDPAGRYVYVNLSMAVSTSGSGPHGAHGSGVLPGYVLKIDTASARTVASTDVDPNPGDNTLTADGRTLLVTHYDLIKWTRAAQSGDRRAGDSNLILVDTASMTVKVRVPICPAAHGVRLSRDGNTAYATCGPDEIAVVDLRANPPSVRRVLLPGASEGASCQRCPYAIGVAPDDTVWVSCLGPGGARPERGGVYVFDPRRGDGGDFDPARTIQLIGSPVFAGFVGSDTAYRAWVPEQGSGGDLVHAYEPGPPAREVATLTLRRDQCLLAHMLIPSPDGHHGYLVCEGDHTGPGSLAWVDLDGPSVQGAVPLGVFPDGVALVPAP